MTLVVAAPALGFGPIAGNALQFDGLDDFAMVSDHDSLDLGHPLSVEFWLYQQSLGHAELGEWLLTKAQAWPPGAEEN